MTIFEKVDEVSINGKKLRIWKLNAEKFTFSFKHDGTIIINDETYFPSDLADELDDDVYVFACKLKNASMIIVYATKLKIPVVWKIQNEITEKAIINAVNTAKKIKDKIEKTLTFGDDYES